MDMEIGRTSNYIARLTHAITDDLAFLSVFEELKADRKLKTAAYKEIAFAFTNVQCRSKPEALNMIWRRHLLMTKISAKKKGRTA